MSVPGGRFASEHSPMAGAAVTATARQLPAMRQYTALWKGGLGDDAPGWLTGRGRQLQFDELAAIAASYRRPRAQNTPRGPLRGTSPPPRPAPPWRRPPARCPHSPAPPIL